MLVCRRKICICRTKMFNLYMKCPKLPNKIWKDKMDKLKKNKSRCSGVMVNNLEKVEDSWKY